MSQENVEIVRAAIDAWNREDWDAAFQDAAAGLEVDMSRAMGPASGVFNLDQARRAYVEFAGNWESVRIEPHEFIEAGDLVVVPYTLYGKGRDGIEVAARPTNVWTIRDGAIERISMYQERQEALEAVGLSESPMSRENVEIARGVAEAFNRHDPEAALGWLAQDVEWHDLPDQPDAEVQNAVVIGRPGRWGKTVHVLSLCLLRGASAGQADAGAGCPA